MHEHTDTMLVTGSRRSQSYLLRLWQEGPDSPWRALLRSVTTKEEYLFHDLAGLVAFLETGRGVKRPLPEIDEMEES
jgi:hypothetical protein